MPEFFQQLFFTVAKGAWRPDVDGHEEIAPSVTFDRWQSFAFQAQYFTTLGASRDADLGFAFKRGYLNGGT